MKKYISSSDFSGNKRLDNYIQKIKRMVNLDLPADYIVDVQWDMKDDQVLLNVEFINGDEHLFTFETWRFTMQEGYLGEDADIILKAVNNYIRNTGIDPFIEESPWVMKEKKTVQDYDGFYTDYTLWYNPVEDSWVCIFGDYELYTPETTSPDAEFETKREAYEWFDSYGEDDIIEESINLPSFDNTSLVDKFITIHDKDELNWQMQDYNYDPYYDELKKYMVEGETWDEVDDEGYPLDSNARLKDLFSRMPKAKQEDFLNRFWIHDNPDHINASYNSEIKSSEEFVDMGTGLNYWYFTTHGVMPGSVPKGLNIIKIIDKPEGTYFLTDRVLTTKSLKYYDIKEKAPKGVIKASSHLNLEDRLKRIIVQEKGWKNFLDTVEYETGLKIDSAYKRRRKGDNTLVLLDEYGGSNPDVYEAEFNEYSDGTYELDGDSIHYAF